MDEVEFYLLSGKEVLEIRHSLDKVLTLCYNAFGGKNTDVGLKDS
ncbi:hypothetical protein KDW_53500 [Dictyobacter vulcani]|uniref:Uncharacterized protein n=1 Tax=Dictyobacter vulcani TaxID=2607529 RepID=A0A5J4KNC1_9CHLR|nr:hypothetical protein KDW_53500 [Dictyobacter vulcani]